MTKLNGHAYREAEPREDIAPPPTQDVTWQVYNKTTGGYVGVAVARTAFDAITRAESLYSVPREELEVIQAAHPWDVPRPPARTEVRRGK